MPFCSRNRRLQASTLRATRRRSRFVRVPTSLTERCVSEAASMLSRPPLTAPPHLIPQRAAMGGERERAELAAFEALLSKGIAGPLVAHRRRDAGVHGVD